MSDSERRQPALLRLWVEWRAFIVFVVVMVVFRSAIADWNQVPTGSMKPTILDGDRVVVNKIAYGLKVPFTTTYLRTWAHPKRGEIVTFFSPIDETLLIKRVIGTPGDIIAMSANQLFINGKPASYSYIDDMQARDLDIDETMEEKPHRLLLEQFADQTHTIMLAPLKPSPITSFPPQHIPDGYYLMLGDNRDKSQDSRFIGLVARERITGRAHTVAFSVDYDRYYQPRPSRFIRPLQMQED